MPRMIPQTLFAAFVGVALSMNAGAQPQAATETPADRYETADSAVDQAPARANDELLERWRQARRGFREWLSIQQIYEPDEAASIQAELDARVRDMSPSELADLVDDIEAKLEVLFSPEAEEARQWLAQFLSVQAMYSPEELRQMRPDIVNMTASQIRQELEQHQQRRSQTLQAQAAFDQSRQQRVQSIQSRQQSQRRAAEQAAQRRVQPPSLPAAQYRSQYAPRREFQPGFLQRPRYTVGPWGGVYVSF